ncbi:MAG: hypothetical protein ACR2OU_06100 [Thermomicrobiales bacterium]
MNSETPEQPHKEPFQGMTAHLIAGLGAALGFGLVTWWRSGEIGLTLLMAALAFIVGLVASRWSRANRR